MSASRNQLAAVEAADSEERWPALTICDGRKTLGFLFDNDDGSVSATDASGVALGNFQKRDGARLAIIVNAGVRHG